MPLNIQDFRQEINYGFKRESIFRNEDRFHAIYLVDSVSGSVLVSNSYSDNKILSDSSEDLISSFLNAMNMFMKEIKTDQKDEIQEVNFKDSRILYEQKGRLMCIGITKKTDLRVERAILHDVLTDFYQKFQREIDQFKGLITPEILRYKKNLETLLQHDINLKLF